IEESLPPAGKLGPLVNGFRKISNIPGSVIAFLTCGSFLFASERFTNDPINYIISLFTYHNHRQLPVLFKIIECVFQLQCELLQIRIILCKALQKICTPLYVIPDRENMNRYKVLPFIFRMSSQNV